MEHCNDKEISPLIRYRKLAHWYAGRIAGGKLAKDEDAIGTLSSKLIEAH